MKSFFAAIFVLSFSPFVSVQVCSRGTSGAKFACAKAGDEFATAGDFAEAKQAWKVSCEEGLQSSCEAVQNMTANLAKFKAQWNSDPINQTERSLNLQPLKCKTDKNLRSKCLADARSLSAKGGTLKAATLLKGMCEANMADACFELGGIELRAERPKASVQPYTKASSLGHTNACSVLSSIQSDLRQNEALEIRQEEQRRAAVAKKQKETEQTIDAVFATAELLSGGKPAPKLRCKTKKTGTGNLKQNVSSSAEQNVSSNAEQNVSNSAEQNV